MLPDNLWSLDDLVGVRAVVLTKSDAHTLAGALLADAVCLISTLERSELREPSGYRAIHLKGNYARLGLAFVPALSRHCFNALAHYSEAICPKGMDELAEPEQSLMG